MPATLLLIGFTIIANADTLPPPDIYNQGPASPSVASTDITGPERGAFALLEGIMQLAEARIAATNCSLSSGTYDIAVYSDGSVNSPNYNYAFINSPGSRPITLTATLKPWDSFWGQQVTINQIPGGGLKQVPITNYYAQGTYNAMGTIMEMNSSVNVKGINGRLEALKGKVIKDFNRITDELTGLPYILDWGVQSIAKLDFPLQQYWQRSKVIRDDGGPGITVFVKDRIVGPNSCRIVIDTQNYNNHDFFYQTGTLNISTSTPDTVVDEFNF